jgi:hypothetical protein
MQPGRKESQRRIPPPSALLGKAASQTRWLDPLDPQADMNSKP